MTISNDKILKFEYDPVTNKWAFPVNDVGCVAPHLLAEYTGTPADASCVFVNTSTGNDSTGAGTQASPYKTIAHAISACDEDKTVVIVLNAATSSEDISGCTFTYFNGLYAASGVTHYLTFRVMGTTWTDDDCIYLEASNESASDENAGTAAAPKKTLAGALASITASKTEIEIADSETYEITGCSLPSNLAGIHSEITQTPTISIDRNIDLRLISTEHEQTSIAGSMGFKFACKEDTQGNLVFFYTEYDNYSPSRRYGRVKILDGDDYSTIKGETVITPQGANPVDVYVDEESGHIIFISSMQFSTYCTLRITVYDRNYVTVVEDTELHTTTKLYHSLKIVKVGDKICILVHAYKDYVNMLCMTVLNLNYAVVTADEVIGYFDGSANFGACTVDSQNVMIVHHYGVVTSFDYYIYNIITKTVTKSSETVSTPTYADFPNVVKNECGDYIVIHSNTADIYATVLDVEYNVLGTFLISNSGIQLANVGIRSNGDLVFMGIISDAVNGGYDGYYIIRSLRYYLLGVVNDLEFNGVIVKPAFKHYMNYLFYEKSEAKIVFKWSEVSDFINEQLAVTFSLANTTGNEYYNTLIIDGDCGEISETDNLIAQQSIFARINKGPALTITGAGSGIIIDHVDIFNCNGGLKLIDNDGSEVLKNSIIHDIDNYSVDAETAIDGDNCVITGISTGLDVSGSTRLFKANPLYINEGLLVPADIDLNIKIKLLGYPANSPAYLLADDGFNAGSHLLAYVGSETTWSSFTIIKPLEVPREIKPLNAVVNTKKSSAYKDGDTETITLNFATLTASEVEDLWKMLCCYRSGRYQYQVRLYPDPTTYPDVYLLCCLDPVNSYVRRSTDLYLWDDDYAQDSKIVLTRRFEVET